MILRFSGIEVEVSSSDYSEIAFQFGPHVVRDSASLASVRVEFIVPARPGTDRNAPAEAEFLVRHGDGTPLLRRAFRGWGTMPPAVPPVAVLRERYALLQAVVLAKRGAAVALVGGPFSEKLSVAAALAHRSWRFVSGQLLVLDRDEGQVLPCLLPLEARGAAATRMRTAGLPAEGQRTVPSVAGGETLLIRPECLGDVVPIHARTGLPPLVRLCRTADEGVRLAPWEFTPQAWPVEAAADFAAAPRYRLELSSANAAEEAAGLIDAELTRNARALSQRSTGTTGTTRKTPDTMSEHRPEKDDDGCLDVPVTGQAAPAGLTASLLT
jgi:hypothetical protein